MAVCALAAWQKMSLCLAWGGSSSEPPVPTGHVNEQDWPLSGHLCGLMTKDEVLTPNQAWIVCLIQNYSIAGWGWGEGIQESLKNKFGLVIQMG